MTCLWVLGFFPLFDQVCCRTLLLKLSVWVRGSLAPEFVWFFLKYSVCWYAHFAHASFSWVCWVSSWWLYWILGQVFPIPPIFGGLVFGDLVCSFDWAMFLWFVTFIYFVTLCWDMHVWKKKNKTSHFSHCLWVWIKWKTSPVNQAKILGASQIFLGMCNLWTSVCNFPVREIATFFVCLFWFFSRRLLSLNSSGVCGTQGSERAIELSFVLSGLQVSSICQFHQCSESCETETSPPGSLLKSWIVWCMFHCSLF